MLVRIAREGCCSQDDQYGPLAQKYELHEDSTVEDLVREVIGSSFLQYSSPNTTMIGIFGNEPFVRVFSPRSFPGREPEFITSKDEKIATALLRGEVRFLFNWRVC